MYLIVPIDKNGYRPPPIACQSINDVESWILNQKLFLGDRLFYTETDLWIDDTYYALISSELVWDGRSSIEFYAEHPSVLRWKAPPFSRIREG